jgi:hypothetical protein
MEGQTIQWSNDTKEVITSRKRKDRHYNGQKNQGQKDKQRSTNPYTDNQGLSNKNSSKNLGLALLLFYLYVLCSCDANVLKDYSTRDRHVRCCCIVVEFLMVAYISIYLRDLQYMTVTMHVSGEDYHSCCPNLCSCVCLLFVCVLLVLYLECPSSPPSHFDILLSSNIVWTFVLFR